MNRDKLINDAMELLDKYDYDYTEDGVGKIVDRWYEQKANVIEAFRKHPNWDEERMAIVLPNVPMVREWEQTGVSDFYHYLDEKILNKLRRDGRQSTYEGKWISDWRNEAYNLESLLADLRRPFTKGMDTKELEMQVAERLYEVKSIADMFVEYDGNYYTKETYNRIIGVRRIMKVVSNLGKGDNVVTDNVAYYLRNFGDFKIHMGQATSKVVRKLCEQFGVFDVDNQRFVDTQGRERGKICERKFADFADSINPKTFYYDVVLSVNPLDYWMMSFGHNWSSCHTIDKDNSRPNNGSNHYNGCYSGGTESYMLDSSTFITYTGKSEDKIKRCNFHVSEHGHLLCQGRVYPDGRDGGDVGLSPWFRHLVQEAVAQCYGLNNEWTIKKGTDACSDYVSQYHPIVNYTDFFHYSDCNVSIVRNVDNKDTTIYVGSMVICPSCGGQHSDQEWITCNACRDGVEYITCDECGERVRDDSEDLIHTYDDRYFCSEECANNAGYYYTNDGDGYRDDGFWDAWDDCYYSYCEVETEDGRMYHSEYNARHDGYVLCDNGEWHKRDSVYLWESDNEYHTNPEPENEDEEEVAI